MQIFKKIGVIVASCAFLVAITVPVLAVNENSNRVDAQNRPSVTPSRAQQATEKKEEAKLKLEATKLKVCQKREKNINRIILRIADRGQKQLGLFTSISEKTQKFATEKGKQPANYTELVAEVNAKKIEAENAIKNTSSKTVTFTCEGTDPKAVVNTFRERLKAEITALKAYKTAVKNLIVGVKSANQTTTPSVSPTPTTNSTTEGGL